MKNLYGKVVLVTGASSGLGLAVANYLYQKGFNVYAGARSFKAESIERNSEGGILHKINLDVTDQTSVGSVLKHITEQENTLDVLVNCAAYLVLGSVEETSFDEYNLVLNTNLYGALRMIKGVLPDMRQHKCGLIVNFSSINGLLGIPYQSAYVASKFAIEGMSECLSLELKNFGVNVALIEPSDHRSGSNTYRPDAVKTDSSESPYSEDFKKVRSKIKNDEANGSDPLGVAKLIYGIIETKKPRLRYRVGKFDQKLSVVLRKILPGRMFEKIIYGYYH